MSYGCLKYWLTLSFLCTVTSKNLNNLMKSVYQADSPVKVTAVFMNCELGEQSDAEGSRFEREELFKHNSLRSCDKKLALTMKLTSASANSADEYVPIDRVVDGCSRSRVRLLNPYVLRLRRDAPLEAYKLRFIEVVSGLLATPKDRSQRYFSDESAKTQQDTKENFDIPGDGSLESVVVKASHGRPARENDAVRLSRAAVELSTGSVHPASKAPGALKTFSAKRLQRHVKNVVIEEDDSSDKNRVITEHTPDLYLPKATNNNENSYNHGIDHVRRDSSSTVLNGYTRNENCYTPPKGKGTNDNNEGSVKEFALYEIEKPSLWFYVHVNLFEKLSTLKGNTLWNDITKGVPVGLSSVSPEWSGPEIHVHYKPVGFVAREDFVLPKRSLCLLVPLLEENMNAISSNTDTLDHGNSILLPAEDILDVHNTDKSIETNLNISTMKKIRRKVIVPVARTLNDVMGDNVNIVNQTSDIFLTMRHRGLRHAQVDLEARADDNQIVHASPPGRIAIIVADNTRARPTFTVQVTNTGLVVARFRAELRDCDSDLIKVSEKHEGAMSSEEVSLPPRHTRRLKLHLQPLPEDAAGFQHCSVYLLNENSESVAVRDALIKKGDHCYCVWHCDCVCYGDDPRLPCREMAVAQQAAAGLPPQRGARFARACHYADVTTINIAVVVIGVIGILLFLGLLKGFLGLVWPRAGVWGLAWILEEPRPIDCYYERRLRAREVVYDYKGWPVDPDTGKRTVRVVSLTVEFLLNVIFFVVIPGLVAVDTLKYIMKDKRSQAPTEFGTRNPNPLDRSKETLIRRHDAQGRKKRARHHRLPPRRWMTPEAEGLIKGVWKYNATNIGFDEVKCVLVCNGDLSKLRPLIHKEHQRPGFDPALGLESNSDEEDTAFVLMRMKKSSESLARNQIKPGTSDDVPIDTICHVPMQTAAEDLDKP